MVLQLKPARVLVRIAENEIHANAVYMTLQLAADDDFIFYISITCINNLEKNAIHCLLCLM